MTSIQKLGISIALFAAAACATQPSAKSGGTTSASDRAVTCPGVPVLSAAAGSDPVRQTLLRCALAEMRHIDELDYRFMSLEKIGTALVDAGRIDLAAALACEPGLEPQRQAWLMRSLARRSAERRAIEPAIVLAEAAERARARYVERPEHGPPPQILPPDPFDASDVWLAIAIAQARAGLDFTAAAAKIGPVRGALALELFDLLRASKPAEAWQWLDQARDEQATAAFADPELATEIALRYFRAGRASVATSLLRKAARDMYSGKDGQGKRDALLVGLGRVGARNEAIAALGGRESVGMLVEDLLDDGDVEGASAACRSMKSNSLSSGCWIAIATKSQTLGKSDQADAAWQAAREHATKEPFPRFRAESLCELGIALHRASRRSEASKALALARDTANAIGDDSERGMALREVCIAYAEVGQCKYALTIVPTGSESDYTVREIAVHCSEPNELDAMRKRALRLQYEDQKGDALGAIAAKLAADGDLSRAFDDVAKIPRPQERVTALLAIARSIKTTTLAPPECPR